MRKSPLVVTGAFFCLFSLCLCPSLSHANNNRLGTGAGLTFNPPPIPTSSGGSSTVYQYLTPSAQVDLRSWLTSSVALGLHLGLNVLSLGNKSSSGNTSSNNTTVGFSPGISFLAGLSHPSIRPYGGLVFSILHLSQGSSSSFGSTTTKSGLGYTYLRLEPRFGLEFFLFQSKLGISLEVGLPILFFVAGSTERNGTSTAIENTSQVTFSFGTFNLAFRYYWM